MDLTVELAVSIIAMIVGFWQVYLAKLSLTGNPIKKNALPDFATSMPSLFAQLTVKSFCVSGALDVRGAKS